MSPSIFLIQFIKPLCGFYCSPSILPTLIFLSFSSAKAQQNLFHQKSISEYICLFIIFRTERLRRLLGWVAETQPNQEKQYRHDQHQIKQSFDAPRLCDHAKEEWRTSATKLTNTGRNGTTTHLKAFWELAGQHDYPSGEHWAK